MPNVLGIKYVEREQFFKAFPSYFSSFFNDLQGPINRFIGTLWTRVMSLERVMSLRIVMTLGRVMTLGKTCLK